MRKNNATSVSAPGSVTLFGEHAVNYGEAAVALAIDVRYTCDARVSPKFSVNDEDLIADKHPWIRGALLQGWTDMDKPIAFSTRSAIPPGMGLGENGARTIACLGSLSMLHHHLILEVIARKAYEVNYEIGGHRSPLDIITSTHGSGVYLSDKRSDGHLWSLEKGGISWHAHQIETPDVDIVIGIAANGTSPTGSDERVKRYYEKNAFARELIRDIGKVSVEGASALRNGDVEKVGRMMTENHKLLVNLGVGNQKLDKLFAAMSRFSFGAKITGSGECIIALTEKKEEVIRAIESIGCKSFPVNITHYGIRLEDEDP